MTTDYNPVELVRAAADGDGSFGGGNGLWVVMLFWLLCWGNNGWGGNGAVATEAMSVYPLMENQQNLFTGFGNLQEAITAGFINAETAATSRQMADMNQMFALQTAMMQGFQAQQSQLAQCCCENRLATANLQADIARENCADRQAIADGIQLIITKLDQQDLYAARTEIDNLRQQNNMLQLAASQTMQTAQIIDALKPATAATGA